jgi:murein DD-endopeptidase MepM/ murein hydrolase activator NlpD
MPKIKYMFNPESLSYIKIRTSFRQKFLKGFTYFSASIVVSIVYYIIFSNFFASPREKSLKRENYKLQLQYEMMSKKADQIEVVLKDMQERDDNIYRTIFETEPIPKTIRDAGFGGVNRYAELENLSNSQIVIEAAKKLDKLAKQVYVQSKSYDEIIKLVKKKEELLASIPAIQPVSNKKLTRVASGWGWRIHPIYKIRKFHEGMDFTAPIGTEIYATGDGVITEVKASYGGYGNDIVVNHGYGYETLYAHLSRFNVKQGQKVKRGDVIGFVGNSGLSTAPHLHYEVHKSGTKLNPVNFYFNDLTPEEFDQMIEISSKSGQTFD